MKKKKIWQNTSLWLQDEGQSSLPRCQAAPVHSSVTSRSGRWTQRADMPPQWRRTPATGWMESVEYPARGQNGWQEPPPSHPPGPARACRDPPSPVTWPPSGRRRQPSGPPWCSPSQRRLRPRERPSPRTCPRWFYGPSDQRRPVAKRSGWGKGRWEKKKKPANCPLLVRGFLTRVLHSYTITRFAIKIKQKLTHLRAPDNKAAAGLQVVDGLVIQVDARNHGFHYLLLQAAAHGLQADVLIVLHWHHDGVDAQRHHGAAVLSVLHSHLGCQTRPRWVRMQTIDYWKTEPLGEAKVYRSNN